MRLTKVLFATTLLVGCATESSTIDHGVEVTEEGCLKIEGSEIGQLITLEVPDADGEGTILVTFTSWTSKPGENNEYTGFTLSTSASGTVKAGEDTFEFDGTSFTITNNNAISNVVLCFGDDPQPEPEPEPDPDPEPEPDPDPEPEPDPDPEPEPDPDPEPEPDPCDKNGDGDDTDEGECNHVPDDDCPNK